MEGVPVYDHETLKKIILGDFMHSVLYFGDEQYIISPTGAKMSAVAQPGSLGGQLLSTKFK